MRLLGGAAGDIRHSLRHSGRMSSHDIHEQPLHLGLGGTAIAQPAFTGMEWYGDYITRTQADGKEGRLVSYHRFTEDWDSWEMHPLGDEMVLCIEGAMTLHQECADGSTATVTLAAGQYVINPPGCWHTADIAGSAAALFITAGWGTQHRAR